MLGSNFGLVKVARRRPRHQTSQRRQTVILTLVEDRHWGFLVFARALRWSWRSANNLREPVQFLRPLSEAKLGRRTTFERALSLSAEKPVFYVILTDRDEWAIEAEWPNAT